MAASVTVTGTLVDSGGNNWDNATIIIQFVPGFGTPAGNYIWNDAPVNQRFSITATGNTFTVSLPSNDTITPIDSQWEFTISGNSVTPAVIMRRTLKSTTPTVDISTDFTVMAPVLIPEPGGGGGGPVGGPYLELTGGNLTGNLTITPSPTADVTMLGGRLAIVAGPNFPQNQIPVFRCWPGGGVMIGNTSPAGDSSLAIGAGTAAGSFTIAQGNLTQANGLYSAAFNSNSWANGSASFVEGLNTRAFGPNCHAEGQLTQAGVSGDTTIVNAHAEGQQASASASASHAGGSGTIAATFAERAIGSFNIASTGSATAFNPTGNAFVIGNGANAANRSNCFVATFDGNVFAGPTATDQLATQPWVLQNLPIDFTPDFTQLQFTVPNVREVILRVALQPQTAVGNVLLLTPDTGTIQSSGSLIADGVFTQTPYASPGSPIPLTPPMAVNMNILLEIHFYRFVSIIGAGLGMAFWWTGIVQQPMGNVITVSGSGMFGGINDTRILAIRTTNYATGNQLYVPPNQVPSVSFRAIP
jgi:hypothetical protein